MNTRIIKALLKKDVKLFISNRFYFILTAVGLIFYVGAYFILPSKVDEKLSLAMYAPVMPPAFEQILKQEGAEVNLLPSEAALKQAILDGDYQAAIALPPDIMDTWKAGSKPKISVYYSSTAPPALSTAMVILVKELSYAQTGQSLNFVTDIETLGTDTIGAKIALRDRIRPLLAVFLLLFEVLTLASLISVEIEQGTARALLVTPMRVSDLFIAKGILGISLALGQALIFMAIVGGFSQQPLIMLTTLLIGSMMVVGIGFLLASVARDVMAVTGWGMLILILFSIPGFGNAIPGLLSDWAKVIPSFYLTDTVNRIANYGAGWSDVAVNLIVLTGFTVVFLLGGMFVLRRRYQ
jgi:ABC-2 type transport system permease protein